MSAATSPYQDDRANAPLLQVAGLSVRIATHGGSVAALSDVDLTVHRGEIVGLVGESGGGKSMLARSVIGMLPGTATANGSVRLDGDDVLTMLETRLRSHRGGGAAMCFQNPRSALSPTRTVGRQLTDRLEIHQGLSGSAARDAAVALLTEVGIRDSGSRFAAYPHEMSGGMCQRVMIALALACSPRLLLADEPTTGLDVTLTREILDLFRRSADQDGRGVLLISHDLASVGSVCDRIVVLYAGTVVESGPATQLLREPAHPYTNALVRSVPDLDGTPVAPTSGTMPLLREAPSSCPFASRCERADDSCTSTRPSLFAVAGDRDVACFHPIGVTPPAAAPAPVDNAVVSPGQAAKAGATVRRDVEEPPQTEQDPPETAALSLTGVDVRFGARFGSSTFLALHDVSLTVQHGESIGIVGESGCGKSTLARVITGLQPVSAGSVRLHGMELAGLSRRQRRLLGRRVQMVFQDPQGALSPRRTALDAVGEPLRTRGLSAQQLQDQAENAITATGLDASIMDRRPSQLSGGQAQRIGIARALAADPELIVLDEPTSALDVTVQAQILDLIKGLAAQRTRSYVFISHDLATVRGFCDRVVVLYLGRVVEHGPAAQIFSRPLHPYTRALLGSAPRLRGTSVPSVNLSRELEETRAGPGCPLAPRCPFAVSACQQPQQLHEYAPGQWAACHRATEISQLADDPAVESPSEQRSVTQ